MDFWPISTWNKLKQLNNTKYTTNSIRKEQDDITSGNWQNRTINETFISPLIRPYEINQWGFAYYKVWSVYIYLTDNERV